MAYHDMTIASHMVIIVLSDSIIIIFLIDH